MNQIDPAEALLSVLGVTPFIYRDVPMVTVAHMEQAQRLGPTIEKQARTLCRGELTGVGLSVIDYDKMLRDLFDDYQPKDTEAAAKALDKNAGHLDMAVLTKFGAVVAFLRGIFPRSSFATLEGQDQLEPNIYDVLGFTAVLDVLDNPMRVFNGMSDASLSMAQVAAVHQVYPTFAAAVDEAVTEMPTELRAAKASFNLAWNTEIGINKWLGRPPVDPDLAALLLAVQLPPPAPPPAKPSNAKDKTKVETSLSEADRSGYAQATMGK